MEFSWQLGVPAQLRNIIDALAQRFREGVEQVPLTMTIPIDAREEHIQDKLLKRLRPCQEVFPHARRSVPTRLKRGNVFNCLGAMDIFYPRVSIDD